MVRLKFDRVKKDFTRYGDLKLAEFCNNVITGLTDNPFFPDIEKERTVLENAFQEYMDAKPEPSERSPKTIAAKNAKKEVLIWELMLLSLLVEYKSKLNAEALISANFELAGSPKPKGAVGLVENIRLKTNGERGMMIVQCDADPNASMYIVRLSTDEESWRWSEPSTSRTLKVRNLPVGEKLFIQMRLQNSSGQSPWSPSVMGMIPEHGIVVGMHE